MKDFLSKLKLLFKNKNTHNRYYLRVTTYPRYFEIFNDWNSIVITLDTLIDRDAYWGRTIRYELYHVPESVKTKEEMEVFITANVQDVQYVS